LRSVPVLSWIRNARDLVALLELGREHLLTTPGKAVMGMNQGYYEVTHVPSGRKVDVVHKTSDWRFDK
jgi:hypothetical protein